MRILAIETSCDETAAAVVEDGTEILSNVIASSRQVFSELAGVIPEAAARRQVECIIPVLSEAMDQAGCAPDSLDALAVTRGPGLLGSLLVGTVTTRMLSDVWGKPLIGVHHTMGHLSSTWLECGDDAPVFPILTLSASGGHTDLWYRERHLSGLLLGRTRDDAAGEAFDKGAKILSLPYPGGPAIAKAAEGGNPHAHAFPLPLKNDPSLDFSFSGLKTSLKYLLQEREGAKPSFAWLERPLEGRGSPRRGTDKVPLRDIAASYQHAICSHLLDRIERALEACPATRELHIVGGLSANTSLRARAEELCERRRLRLRVPATLSSCTDNAAMIAAASFFMLQENPDTASLLFTTEASLPLEGILAGVRSRI